MHFGIDFQDFTFSMRKSFRCLSSSPHSHPSQGYIRFRQFLLFPAPLPLFFSQIPPQMRRVLIFSHEVMTLATSNPTRRTKKGNARFSYPSVTAGSTSKLSSSRIDQSFLQSSHSALGRHFNLLFN